jgi:hypothetical protein
VSSRAIVAALGRVLLVQIAVAGKGLEFNVFRIGN